MREAHSYAYSNIDTYGHSNTICHIYPYFNADYDATANSHT
jgi:hypothetical protein